jgi:malonate-semialdehyde dehydrogenase (acetylating)/methylmalonate-semialdehyde dehydrogenase
MSEQVKKLKYCVNGEWVTSATETYMNCYNPSTGEVIAHAPQCTAEEVESAVAAAKAAYPEWSNTPVVKRVQVLFKLKTLLEKHLDELTEILAREMGKAWEEAKGDVLKVIEVVEYTGG